MKWWGFSSILDALGLSYAAISAGIEFHAAGPAKLMARSLKFARTRSRCLINSGAGHSVRRSPGRGEVSG